MRARPSVVVLSVLALACGGGDEPRVHVATLGSEFVRRGIDAPLAVVVPFTITNRSDQTVYVPACGDRPVVIVDRGNGKAWEQYSGSACLAVYPMVPIELRPGQSITDGYGMYEAGTYRLRLQYGLARAAAEQSEDAASGAFVVR